MKQRCYVVHAIAPPSVSARDANDALNAYIEGRDRLDALRKEEPEDPRFWWQRRRG